MDYEAYAHPSEPWQTDFGGDVFDDIPSGQTPVLLVNATHGNVELVEGGWRFSCAALPAVANGSVNDSWQWVPSGGGDPRTVSVVINNIT